MTQTIAIIGGGIAGISTAYSCSLIDPTAEVVLVEAEKQLAYHTTGRSAALLYENYGEASVRGLTRASLNFCHVEREKVATLLYVMNKYDRRRCILEHVNRISLIFEQPLWKNN